MPRKPDGRPRQRAGGKIGETAAAGVARLAERAARLGAPRRALAVGEVKPMLAETGGRAFTRQGWIFELKYDGYRVLAGKGAAGGLRLVYRSGREATAAFPEIARAVAALPAAHLVLDGEVVVLDAAGRPRFEGLQNRGGLTRPAEVERAAVELPATYFAFDLLALEGHDLRPLPLVERKALLAALLPSGGALRFADHVEERGEELYAAVAERGLEGLVAKRADSPYRAGRQPAWVKLRADRTGDFAVVGYTRPKGARAGFGALQLAARTAGGGGGWTWVGRVGSGFTERQLADLVATLDRARRARPVCAVPKELAKDSTWVEPRLVVEVRYSEMTAAGQLRQPVFLRLRDDKRVEECVLQQVRGAAPGADEPGGNAPAPAGRATRLGRPAKAVATSRSRLRAVAPAPGGPRPAPPPTPPPTRHPLQLTRLDKVFWPADGYTKGDLLDYYRAVSPHLLPYLHDRPVVLDRFPDGIAGKSFFQKNAPDYIPGWLRTERVWTDEDDPAEARAFIADDLDSLLYLVNLGVIPLHLGASRVATLDRPDWSILDLDAKDAPFAAAVRAAHALHGICERLELPVYLKTSGASGLHLLIPLGARTTHEQAKHLAELLARLVVSDLPAVASVARLPPARRGKVYVDALQNGFGKLLVAPYSVRPRPRAPVSTPLEWSELSERLDPADWNLETVPRRLARIKRDPMRPVLEEAADIPRALALLAERFG
jgi:bifunctional non-homologous end joining protein LigD